MQITYLNLSCSLIVGVDNWSRLHTKLVSLCPDFNKDAEACRKKWGAIYKDYKYDKFHNSVSGNSRSDKCKWYVLVDEFMSERANVVSHAHGSAYVPEDVEKTGDSKFDLPKNPDELKDRRSEKRKKEDALLSDCLEEVRSSRKLLLDTIQATETAKLELFKSMQETMAKLIDKI